MEESRTQLILVTEPIFASSLDLLSRFEGLPGRRDPVRLSELDCKAGLLQARLSSILRLSKELVPVELHHCPGCLESPAMFFLQSIVKARVSIVAPPGWVVVGGSPGVEKGLMRERLGFWPAW